MEELKRPHCVLTSVNSPAVTPLLLHACLMGCFTGDKTPEKYRSSLSPFYEPSDDDSSSVCKRGSQDLFCQVSNPQM